MPFKGCGQLLPPKGGSLMTRVKCDWCNKDVERNITKFWHTGARICPSCHSEGVDKDRKFQEEFRQEMSKGSFLDNTGW